MSYNKVIINGETKIDLTTDTVAADKMLADTTAHDKAGEQVTGTIPVDQEPEVSGTTKTYKAGYYSTPIVVEEGATGEGDPIISGSVEDKTLVLNKQSGAEINVDLSPLDNSYIKKSGDTVTGPLNVAEPTEDANAATKKYVDESVKSVYPTEVVTGNPVVCEDGAEYGLQGLKIFGKSTQDGTPSPENPVPIVSAGEEGEIDICVSGRNLFDVSNAVENRSYNTSGELTNTTGYVSSQKISCGNERTFTMSSSVSSIAVIICEWDEEGVLLNRLARNSINKTYTLNETTAQIAFTFYNNLTAADLSEVMLNVGSAALPFESYKTPQSLSFDTPDGLPGIPVDSGGNYTDTSGQQWICNYRDWARGVDVKNYCDVTLDGTIGAGFANDNVWHLSSMDMITLFGGVVYSSQTKKNMPDGFSSRFITQNSSYDLTDEYENTLYISRGGEAITINAGLFPTPDLDGFKQYFSENPTRFVLHYLTYIETPIPAEELAAYRALHTYDGTTTISTSEDVSGIEVQYLKKNRALPTSNKQDAGRVVTVNDQGQFSLTDKYLDGVDLDSIFSLFIDGKNTTEMFWKWYPLTDKYGSTKYTRLERWCKLLANAWSNKTYTLRFYKASVSGAYTGTPLDDLADGRQAAPLVTDSSEPTEDWAENDPMTWYIRANALSLADGTMNILYFEGEDGFDITGEIAPVYSFALNLYLKHWTDESYKYTSWKTVKADGYNSMAEGIAPDNSYRTVTWHPSFDGGLNVSGGLTSGAGKKPVIWTSAQDALPLARKITPYEGLWTDCDQQYVLSQWQLRHWTLENSDVLNGCQSYNYQYTLAVAESDVKRLIVTTEQGANFIVGSNVCLGEKGANENNDRNQAYNHDIFNCATITSIENVNISEADYTALNLDIEEPITTTTTMLVSTIAWSSGTTEALQGHSDGCIENLTNGKYPIRVAGIEIMNGANVEELDPLWQASIVEDHWKYEVYSCRDSEKQAGSITGNYEKIGEFTLPNAEEYSWNYIKDMNELESEAMIPLEFEGSSSTYYRSAFNSSGGSGGVRCPWRGGSLCDGPAAGLACASGYLAPGDSHWDGAARLTGAGKKRGESAP